MTRVRPFLFGVGAVVVLLLAAAGVAASSWFQTWAVRRALVPPAGGSISVDSVSAGLRRIEVAGLRVEREGRTLFVPRLNADASLFAALVFGELTVSRLQVDAFTLEMPTPRSAAGPVGSADTSVQACSGLLAAYVLPAGVVLDGLDCAGLVTFPGLRGTAAVRLTGGGLRPGGTGRFVVSLRSTLTEADVAALEFKGEVALSVAGDRRITVASARLAATARGRRFPDGVALQGDFAVRSTESGETYAASVVAAGREVLNLAAEFSPEGGRLQGGWKIDLRDHDVAPFSAGRVLPDFSTTGQGTFATTFSWAAVRVTGKLRGAVDHLERWAPDLPALGAWQVEGDFDLGEQNGVIGVRKFEAVVGTTGPVASLRSLQAFEFDPRTREVRAADPLRDVLGVVLHGLPLHWINPWLGRFQLSGDGLRGELVASPRGGGVALRSVGPLSVERAGAARDGRLCLDGLQLASGVTADYSPQGWQTEFKGLTARQGGRTVMTLDAKVGGLTGPGQGVKTAGRASFNLPALLTQPFAGASSALESGEAVLEFAASFNQTTELQASVAAKHLAIAGVGGSRPLPAVSLQLRADVDAKGRVVLDLPIVLERGGAQSDLRFAGSIAADQAGTRQVDLQCAGSVVDAVDFAGLGALRPLVAPRSEAPDTAAVWSRWRGALRFQFRTFKGGDGVLLRNAGGRLLFAATTLKLEEGIAGLADGAQATATGGVEFEPQAAKPYRMAADVVLKDYDLGPLWRGSGRTGPAVLDGRFEVTGRLTARARQWTELAEAVGGEFQLTSKGGIFRGLPASVANPSEPARGLAGLFASAGTMLAGGLSGRKEQVDIANRSEAVAELARSWNAIVYDQLSIRVLHDAAFNTLLRDFSLITPELRLSGYGTALHQPGRSGFDDALMMKFRLRARGRQADLLKYLGALEAQTDDLGYTDCVFPLTVGGTLGRPDATELNHRLMALASGRPGLTDKAAELLNKLWGGAKAAP